MSASNRIYKVMPITNPRIWGTDRLASLVHLPPSNVPYGEIFLVSSMEGAQSVIDGREFDAFYQAHPEFFNLSRTNFPLRINLIDTSSPLSIQVHPGSEVTQALGYPQGVHEFWFILDARPTSTIEVGHRFENKKQMEDAMSNNGLRPYCVDVPAHRGQTYLLYPGTMHAIGSGLLVYELTYNLDLTYRLYDYDRIDPKTGKGRTLHLEEAMAAITFPQRVISDEVVERKANGIEETTLVDEPGVFTLKQWKVDGDVTLPIDAFYICTLVEGAGWIDETPLRQFETVFVPATCKELRLIGEMTVFAASYRE